MTTEREQELKVTYRKCRKSFLFYVRYMFKNLYGTKYIVAEHHIKIAEALEAVVRGEIVKLIINIAPRYGKTELAVKMWISWCLAFNSEGKFIHLSYSDSLALDNSEEIKDIVESAPFRELFGEFELKKDSKSKKKWYTSKKGGVYATSTGGQVTGFGSGKMDEEEDESWPKLPISSGKREALREERDNANLKDMEDLTAFLGAPTPYAVLVARWVEDFHGATVIDDANKPEDAGSDIALKKVNTRFESTIRHRVNSRRTPIVVIGQRIDPDDLCGHLIALEPDDWHVLSLPCIKEDGTALWDHKHTLEELDKIRKADSLVFENQYMQNPKPRAGLMYGDFETYKKLPALRIIRAYADTADDGADFLCDIAYGIPENREDKHLYLIDALYTNMPMEKTEPLMAAQLELHNVRQVDIESNNGGKGFARKINELTSSDVYVRWFFQKLNKASRIYTNSGSVNVTFLMPEDWERRFPQFYQAITRYKKEGGNAHDDAPDTLTGCYEKSRTRVLV